MKLFAFFGLVLLILAVGLTQFPQQVAGHGQNTPPPPPQNGNGNGNQQGGQGQNGQNGQNNNN
ncbi:uncharacterized protein [Drosophila bipectinata]|uniref:uncharacterized protein n=1 Tax=Drosophila bipectinata TaxID=42026 RepID=UPI001C8A7845|nr:uncharacterized protein LOC122321292 [Drosophila bipectinata]